MLQKQKLALLLIIVAIGLTILGRWGISNQNLRERDVWAIFGGGFVAGLAVVRFAVQLRKTPAPATATAPAGGAPMTPVTPAMSETPTPPPPPRSKS